MMQPTEVLHTHIKAPDVLVMPGIFLSPTDFVVGEEFVQTIG